MTTREEKCKNKKEETRLLRVGKKMMQKCGMEATIVDCCEENKFVDIRFSDGTELKHQNYYKFVKGRIFNPNIVPTIGEEKEMRDGRVLRIVDFINNNNITLMDSSGQIKDKFKYKHFVNGTVCFNGTIATNISNKQNRVGEKIIQNCGDVAEIISYINSNNIALKFSDGTIVENKAYGAFVNGEVANPNHKPRIGEINMANNGMMMKIIKYENVNKITVMFEDGEIVEGKQYSHFINGCIVHPTKKGTSDTSLQEFAIHYYLRNYGFRKIKQGEWEAKGFGKLELDFYHDEKCIAIEYDGGFHNKQITYERDLRKNTKCNEMGIILYRLRDPSLLTMLDGNSTNYLLKKSQQIAVGLFDCKKELEEILTKHKIHFNKNDIDFHRDKDIIREEYYKTHINYYKKERVGQRVFNNAVQQWMELISYNDVMHVSVRFEDGAIRNNVRYEHFLKGNVKHPEKTKDALEKQRLGKTMKMKNGRMATIKQYESAIKMMIEFDDGSIRDNITYRDFMAGSVSHPSELDEELAKQRLGQRKLMQNGKYAEIILYENSKKITLKFEDGAIVNNVTYQRFEKGNIQHPDDTLNGKAKQRLGEKRIHNKYGEMKIIEYRQARDIDVEFLNTGTIVRHCTYSNFKKGRVIDPKVKK